MLKIIGKIPDWLELVKNSQNLAICKILVSNQVPWLKLSGNEAPYNETGPKTVISWKVTKFPKILIGFQNSYLFLNLSWESSSLTKIE